ncbi:type VII secretion-associated serine protease mycosin [Streptomyces griseocarneus]|uniref:type VII secretion-associated serine protease mycosin n=1 Tax=Streptomyces griseocarneus TaxID=51201 RepID=UPI00167E8D5C|nr:type VII secretion-associated serine protease mycosin [Streptomyces griseocarneus]MBZ6478063.1 type VII secretion-associated serine protease mycosin [Streptomyces griseocarneus]GHG55089.1 type VII secretion-associated serine protease [Streptomyces griseocarneus]
MRLTRRAVLAATTALTAALLAPAAAGSAAATGSTTAAPASSGPTATALNGSGECDYPAKPIKGTPWALQRVLLDQLWQDTKGRDAEGRPVRVAVIDTGVDVKNPQLAGAVDVKSGTDLLSGPKDPARGPAVDLVGHGTKVAGIIAARPSPASGFVGIAPESVIIPIRQNDEKGTGTSRTLAVGIKQAVDAGARVINISQETTTPPGPDADRELELAVGYALARDVVVVASAGNDGADGLPKPTYPAAYQGVLAVGASDRNNERAPFSQSGDFIGVAAPGVDMVSTVPGGGQCVDYGTSFAAPYVAGVAALIRAKHPDWKQHQVVAQIEQTAERVANGRDRHVGWGVVDPARALTEDDHPIDRVTTPQGPAHGIAAPQPAALPFGESERERQVRLATYALGGTAALVAVITGSAVVVRDRNRRRLP